MPEFTEEFIKENEDMIKSLAKKLNDEIDESKKAGNELPPGEVELKMKRMIADQLKASDIVSTHRRKGVYDENYEKSAMFLGFDAEKEIKQIESMSVKDRFAAQEMKMLAPQKMLQGIHGKELGNTIEEFKRLNDDAHLVSTMLYLAEKKRSPHADFMTIYRGTDIYKSVHRMLASDSDLRKAMAVGNVGTGAEWIPTGFSSQVLAKIELNLKVSALFPTLAMPTNPYKMPVQISNAIGYLIAENTTDTGTKFTASTPGTASPEFSAIKLAGRTVFSDEINEDAIVNMRSFIVAELSKSIARAEETAVINGQRTTQALHQDNQGAVALFTSTNDARLAFDGLRYLALNNAGVTTKDFAGADISDVLMGGVRTLSGKYGVMPSEGAWVLPVNAYLKGLYLLTNATTLEKYGPNATILAGELFKYQNVPVVVSEYVLENSNASGVYDSVTTNLTELLFVNRPSFIKGTRGGVSLGSVLNIETDQISLVAKKRLDFVDPYDATLAGNSQVTMGFNIKTA